MCGFQFYSFFGATIVKAQRCACFRSIHHTLQITSLNCTKKAAKPRMYCLCREQRLSYAISYMSVRPRCHSIISNRAVLPSGGSGHSSSSTLATYWKQNPIRIRRDPLLIANHNTFRFLLHVSFVWITNMKIRSKLVSAYWLQFNWHRIKGKAASTHQAASNNPAA